MSADFREAAETALHCAKKLMGKPTIPDSEFFEKFIQGRSGMTRALHSIIQMKTNYMMEKYEAALEMVKIAKITSF